MRHLAMIMDGNRRWALKNKRGSVYSRREVLQAVRVAATFCIQNSISYLSLFMLSLENVQQRSRGVLENIFQVLVKTCDTEADELIHQGIRVSFVGDRSQFPERVRPAITSLEEKTKEGKSLHLSFLFFYGGRQEVISAVKSLARKVQEGVLLPDEIDETLIHQHLWTADIPYPDLIIRTGAQGATRLSNFFLFQAAYSELQFLERLWPEITKEDLTMCMREYRRSSHNRGA